MSRPGDKIGPYHLVRQLGRGTFGVVWLAERRSAIVTTKFAIKLPRDEDVDVDAIKQEASVWVEAGGHPNVLSIIEADVYDNRVVIVSEYAPDGSLSDWLRSHGGKAPSIQAAVEMTLGILAGLEHLHRRRIIHRDLKPENILLQGETPRLADFGIARVLKTSVQGTTRIAGTLAYMAPEVFEGQRSEQADLWAVGVIFYQFLNGSLPFPLSDEMSPWQIMGIIKTQNPLPSTAPEPFQEIITRSLEKRPDQRYKSAADMRSALRLANQRYLESEAALQAEKERKAKIRELVLEGAHAFDANEYSLAIEKWREVLKLSPDEAGIKERIEAAHQAIREQTELRAKLDGMIQDGVRAFNAGQQELAISKWEEVLSLSPDEPSIRGYIEAARQEQLKIQESLEEQARQAQIEKRTEEVILKTLPGGGQTIRETDPVFNSGDNAATLVFPPFGNEKEEGTNLNTLETTPGELSREKVEPEQPMNPQAEIVSPKRAAQIPWLVIVGAVTILIIITFAASQILWSNSHEPGLVKTEAPESTEPGPSEPIATPVVEAMTYYVEVEQASGGTSRVSGFDPLNIGERFRLHFTPRENGYLYIIAPGDGDVPTTFLTAKPIRTATDFQFPSGSNWIRVQSDADIIPFTIVFSSERLKAPKFLVSAAGRQLNEAEQKEIEMLAAKLEAEPSSDQAVVKAAASSDRESKPLIFDIRIRRK